MIPMSDRLLAVFGSCTGMAASGADDTNTSAISTSSPVGFCAFKGVGS